MSNTPIIKQSALYEGFYKAYYNSVMLIPNDIRTALEKAYENESNPIAKMGLEVIVKNIIAAKDQQMIICQDTGIAEFHIKLGTGYLIEGEIKKTAQKAVKDVTESLDLIPHCVHPFSRKNTLTNTGYNVPLLNFEVESQLPYLEFVSTPVAGVCIPSLVEHMVHIEEIEEFVINAIKQAGGGCGPFVIGVGIGGSYDTAMKLSRKATIRPLNEFQTDQEMAGLEKRLLEKVNKLGLGTMNFGGAITALAVNIEYAGTHTACNPVAVRVECWCTRRGVIRIYPDGKIIEIL